MVTYIIIGIIFGTVSTIVAGVLYFTNDDNVVITKWHFIGGIIGLMLDAFYWPLFILLTMYIGIKIVLLDDHTGFIIKTIEEIY